MHAGRIYTALTVRGASSLDHVHAIKQRRSNTSACLAWDHKLRMTHPQVSEVGSFAQGTGRADCDRR